MIRKLLVVAAAIAMPVSVVAVSGGLAGASNPHTAGTDTITCKTLKGTVSFSPALTLKGYTSGVTTTTVKTTLSGCTVKGSTKEKVTGGTASGTIKSTKGKGGTCGGLTAASITDAGTLTTKWTATPAAAPSVLNIKSVAGAVKSSHGTFTIPGKVKGTATGSFLGTNKGASDKTVAQTTETTTALATACASSAGLKSLAIETEPGTTPISLG
ncbi:MAG: hypothetical protein ABSC41_18495 [Acidimicrobiales bacterium]|jgi:hypothetical protein